MARQQLYADLAAVRALVTDGRVQLRDSVGDLDHFWLNSARQRLDSVDEWLVAAAGGLPFWGRAAVELAALFGLAWAVATGTAAAGLGPAGVIVVTTAVSFGATPGFAALLNGLSAPVNRRRLARVLRRSRPLRVSAFRNGRLTAVPEPLRQARLRLVSTALRQVEAGRRRSPYLRELARDRHRSIGPIAEADLRLGQGIDFLQNYLDEQAEGRSQPMGAGPPRCGRDGLTGGSSPAVR